MMSLCNNYLAVTFEPTTYTVTEGVDEFIELIIIAEKVKQIVAINVSFVSDTAEGKLISQ